MQSRLQRAREALKRAQDRQKADADKRRRPVSYEVGQDVLLSTANIKFKGVGTKKLAPKWVGPYKIVELIGPAAVRLALPKGSRIHPVFHVSLVKPFKSTDSTPPAEPLTIDGDPALSVEALTGHRDEPIRGGCGKTRREYLVKYANDPTDCKSYEPERNLRACPELNKMVDAYEEGLSPALRNPHPVLPVNWDEVKCKVCNEPEPADTMVLCSKCNSGWHMPCLSPPLAEVPKGRWYCPPCQATYQAKKQAQRAKKQTEPIRRSERLQQR
uniref:Putative chromo-protein n=1 Tax=Chlamydomonas reinhardtii TaxID=3055 RepID=Q84UZ2_CHLRE|nr:putative chromo-protein [Chlamydomonas reinhardtii]